MFRQSPSRNQRSKSFKIKHGLQIFLLVAICFWLLYQVKHSHDKKKAFDENSMKFSAERENDRGIAKLGRKDLHPRFEDKGSENELHGKGEVLEREEEEENKAEEEEENKAEEDEENKPEEGEEEENKLDEEGTSKQEEEQKNKHEEEADEVEENKPEETEEEGGGAEDDEIDEQDQEKVEEEAENGEDFVDEEEKGGKEETEEVKNEEKVGQRENASLSDDQDHDKNTQEAREENYKRDDASSAVVRDSENGNLGGLSEKKLEENTERNDLELDGTNKTEKIVSHQNNPDPIVAIDEKVEADLSSNAKTIEEKGNEGSGANSTLTESADLPEVSKSSTDENVDTPSLFPQNKTSLNPVSARDQVPETNLQNVDQAEKSNITSGTTPPTAIENPNVAKGEFSDTSNKAETITLEEQTGKSSSTDGDSSFSATKENMYETQSNKTEITDGTTEADDSKASSTINENADVIQSVISESNNSVLPDEEKDALADLGTLPETETEGINNKDAEAE